MSIILCGLPMSGKTTVGKIIAERLHWNFIDTDRLIESAYEGKTKEKLSCRQIFSAEGEVMFRKLEKQQIASLKGSVMSIIAVGGGCLNDPENIKMLQSIGDLVYLKADAKILWRRSRSRGIAAYLDPDDPEKAFYEMAMKRTPFYEKTAKFTIETSHLGEQEIATAILKIRDL